MSKKGYTKVKGAKGIYKHHNSKNYIAMKKSNGKQLQETFSTIFEAKQWRKKFDETSIFVLMPSSAASIVTELILSSAIVRHSPV